MPTLDRHTFTSTDQRSRGAYVLLDSEGKRDVRQRPLHQLALLQARN